MRLTAFELRKVWGRPSFVLAFCILQVVNLFLMWYVNLPREMTPPLSAYKAFGDDIVSMSEASKADYITGLKEEKDGIAFVQSIQSLQAMGSEMGTALAQQELNANPGLFEKYYDLYQSGDYLIYTDRFEQESLMIGELYQELSTVSAYPEYLASIRQNKGILSGVGIFGSTDTFSTRNTRKSVADYVDLENVEIRWQPSKGITIAMENSMTDVLLFLCVFLFTGGLITEEKEKGLFYITRTTRYGMTASICAKLGALLIHCVAVTALMISSNLLYAGITTGLGDLRVSIQSLAPYMQSNLGISVLKYILLSILTKSIVFFGFGAFLSAVSICSDKGFVPYFAGLGVLAVSWILYAIIPGYSDWNILKYLNPIALLETEKLYGDYLNLNIVGHPVSRLVLSWIVILAVTVIAVGMCLVSFLRARNLELKREQISFPLSFRPHGNLMRHEAYKILITNRALLILICFAVLLGYYDLSREYQPSIQEQYYQQIMLQLEGPLDDEKDSLVQAEQARFAEAFEKIQQIDGLVTAGEINAAVGDAMKLEWESILIHYPAFQRVMLQYENGIFVYDTGYLYLFGKMDDSYLINLLLLSVCMVLAFHNVISMEYRKNSWFLLSTTKSGRWAILMRKIVACLICAAVMAILPWVFRSVAITQMFPMSSIMKPIQSIPAFADFGLNIPILYLVLLAVLSQVLAVMVAALIILSISQWRKNDMQALFFCLLILVIPLVLKLMGLNHTEWFSVFPLYAWII